MVPRTSYKEIEGKGLKILDQKAGLSPNRRMLLKQGKAKGLNTLNEKAI